MPQALTSIGFRERVERPLNHLLSPESIDRYVQYCKLYQHRSVPTFTHRKRYCKRIYKDILQRTGDLVRSFGNQTRYLGSSRMAPHGTLTPRQVSVLMAIYVYQAEQPTPYRGIPSGPTRSAIETLTGLKHNTQMTKDLKTLESLNLLHRVRVTPLPSESINRRRGTEDRPPGGLEVSFVDRQTRRHVEYRLSARSRTFDRVPGKPLDGSSAGGSGEGIFRNPSRRNYLSHLSLYLLKDRK